MDEVPENVKFAWEARVAERFYEDEMMLPEGAALGVLDRVREKNGGEIPDDQDKFSELATEAREELREEHGPPTWPPKDYRGLPVGTLTFSASLELLQWLVRRADEDIRADLEWHAECGMTIEEGVEDCFWLDVYESTDESGIHATLTPSGSGGDRKHDHRPDEWIEPCEDRREAVLRAIDIIVEETGVLE